MVLKLEAPIREYMQESAFTNAQCEALYQMAKEACTAANLKNCNEDAELISMFSKMSVNDINKSLMAFVKNRYGLNARKLADQTKELNDLYTKIDDMLKHDKMARFKHRNDRINVTTKDVYLIDVQDTSKQLYRLTYDFMAFNSEYFIEKIDKAVDYIHQNGDKKEDAQKMRDDIMTDIEAVYAKHKFISHFKPTIICKDYRNQKLEDCLNYYKDSFSNYYYGTAQINAAVQGEMQYLQLCQQAYNKMSARYGRDKNGKYIVDEVFKKLLYYATMSIDYNNSIIDTLTEAIRYYVTELEKIYDIIRS